MQETGANETFQLGVDHHKSGRLVEAEALYRQVLARWPEHAGALNMMGVLACQTGRGALAEEH